MNRTAQFVLNRLYRNPDECVAIDHAPGRTSYLRVRDDLTIEVVEKRGPTIGERHTIPDHYAMQVIKNGSVDEYRPVSHILGVCNPADRPQTAD